MQSSPQFRGRGPLRLKLPQWEQTMLLRGRRQDRSCLVDPILNEHCVDTAPAAPSAEPEALPESPLRLLSFNIQVGISTGAFREYLTNGWKHVLPHENRLKNLRSVSDVVQHYDVVALQEVDGGSLRSGFINQVEYLAESAEFPYWYAQTNRDLGPLAQHGNGLLTRIKPHALEDHKLPGAIPGRGAVFVRVPYAGDELVIVMLHLSLGERSRQKQLAYVAEQVAHERQVVVMGDLNMPLSKLLCESPLKNLNLRPAQHAQPTYPAWEPSKTLDHVLVSSELQVTQAQVLDDHISDHLPVAVEVTAKRPSLQ